MFLGKQSQGSTTRGLSPSLRRQLLLLFALLAGTALLGLQVVTFMSRSDPAAEVVPEEEEHGFGKRLETPAGSGSLAPLPGPEPPEPFERKLSVLARGALADRTNHFADKLIAYLLQKVRTREDFYAEKPVLSLGKDGGKDGGEEKGKEEVWEEILQSPNKYRGELVEIEGEILSPRAGAYPLRLRGLDAPNPSGLDRAYQSYVMGIDGKYYMVATARKQHKLAHRDFVRLRGYFCQLYTYPTEYRGETVDATIPLLVGDDYELLERPSTGVVWSGEYLPFLGAVGLFAVAAVIWLQWRSDRRYEARRLAARARIRGVRKDGGAQGAPPGRSPGEEPPGSEPEAGES